MEKNKKNLIIGAIVNYNWEILSPFFNSFKEAKFKNCECVMFVGNMEEITINKIKSLGVIVYEIPKKFKNKNIINFRWKIYEKYLNENMDKYNLIFTTDLRDSIFQKDVFNFYDTKKKKSFIGFALEEDNICNSSFNKKWLINAYGFNFYNSIKNKRIICVGTIWGTPDKFKEFSKIMWEILDSKWSLKKKVIEQAVCNYLIYHDKLFNDSMIISENKNGPIMTIGRTNRKDILIDSNDNILNRKLQIAAVIHQYDRHKDIVSLIRKKYCSKDKEFFKLRNNIKGNNEKLIIRANYNFILFILGLLVLIIKLFIALCKFIIKRSKNKIKNYKISKLNKGELESLKNNSNN